MVKIEPSILSCDQTRLGEQVAAAAEGGADFFHIDVMDGVYVANLTFGPRTVSDLKKMTAVPLSVHLELYHPENYVEMFAKAGADILTFQLDAATDPAALLERIRAAGMQAGIALRPGEPVEALYPLLSQLDRIILMSVEPGFEKQTFNPCVFDKLAALRAKMAECGCAPTVAVDGGVTPPTAYGLAAAGADVLIVGSYVFYSPDITATVAELKNI